MARAERSPGFSFGPFELSAEGELQREGTPVPLSGKPLRLLVHLLEQRDRLLAHADVREALWPGTHVSDAAYYSVIRDLRRALGDSAQDPRFVATYHGRGLRFVHEAAEIPAPGAEGGPWADVASRLEQAVDALERVAAVRGLGEPRLPAAERGALLVALGRARWAGGATAGARREFLRAAEVGRRPGEGELFAHAALGLAGRTDVTPGVNAESVALLEEALERLPPGDDTLRSEVLARLGTELHHEADGSRAMALTAEAVAMAEALRDPAALAYALICRHFTLRRPSLPPLDRLPLCQRALALVEDAPPSDLQAWALQELALDQLELGDGGAFRKALARHVEATEPLEQPFFGFVRSFLGATAAVLDGRLEEAEDLARATLAHGRRSQSPNAEAAFAAGLYAVREAQGRLAELAPLVEGLTRGEGALSIARAALAPIAAAAGNDEQAHRVVGEFVSRDLDALPRDENWVGTLSLLAPVAADRGGDWAALLFEHLYPLAGRIAVAGHGALVCGAVDHQLGLLAASLGEAEAARHHFSHARRLHGALGAPRWTARSEEALRGAGAH